MLADSGGHDGGEALSLARRLERMRHAKRIGSLLSLLFLALAIVGGASASTTSSTAQLGSVVETVGACETGKLRQPFLAWGDDAWYQLVPGGDFESWAAGWRLSGDVKVASGSETFAVSSNGDKYSLRLRGGSSAVSPAVCVSVDTPTFRLFVRNGGPSDSQLAVDVGVGDGTSTTWTRVANLRGGSAWQPTDVLPIGVPAFMQEKTGTALVQLRFSPSGSNASWQVDDVFLDPFKR